MAQGVQQTSTFKSTLASSMDKFFKNSMFLNDYTQNGLAQINNPKWLDFDETGIRRKEALVNNSVAQGLIQTQQPTAAPNIYGGRYNPFANVLYASLDSAKANRIYEYQTMASFPEVADAIEEICNAFITLNEFNRPCTLRYDDPDMPLEQYADLQSEFNYFLGLIDLKNNGVKMCREYLTCGEVFYELVINNERPENKKVGILGIEHLMCDLVETVYKNKENGVIGAFIGRKIFTDPQNNNQIVHMEHIPYHPNQMLYIASDTWDPTGQWVVPYIERARKRYIQLSYLEDAIIIYRLVRAPERLIFKVDTGNMPSYEANRYLNQLRQNYWNSKTFDINTGDIMQKFEPQSMLDSFWIAKGAGNDGIDITQLAGGQNLGQLDDLMYFIKALYRALRVPVSRLNPEANASVDGSQILQEELRFAEFIIRLQRKFAESFKQAFITHLKLQGKYQEYKIKEALMEWEFVPPSAYYQMRNLQGLKIKADAFNAVAGAECFSKSILMKQIMGMNNEQVLEHYRLRKLEAAKEWEIAQIQSVGPDFLQINALQQAGINPDGSAAGGGDMGGGMDMGGGGGMDLGGGADMSGGDMGGGDAELGAATDSLDASAGENPE